MLGGYKNPEQHELASKENTTMARGAKTESEEIAQAMYKVRVGNGVNKSALYFTTCSVDTCAEPNLMIGLTELT